MIDGEDKRRYIDLQKVKERVCEFIACDKAVFTIETQMKQDYEYVDVGIEYEVCGVHYDKDNGALKLIININDFWPMDVYMDTDALYDELTLDVSRNFKFLLRDTFYLSIDVKSMSDLNRQSRLATFKSEMESLINQHGFKPEEALPTIIEYLKEVVRDTRFRTMERLLAYKMDKVEPKEGAMILDISPFGVPCPHCNSILSHEELMRLRERLYRLIYGDDWDCY